MTEVVLRTYTPDDADWLTQLHADLYARDEGFDDTFGPLVAEILAAFSRDFDPAYDQGLVAERDGERLGTIFCVRSGEDGVAKLRLFILEPKSRGLGLGQKLLDANLAFARAAGYTSMRLWTHESHQAACALYAKNGFALTKSEAVHSFGVDLVEQTWERDL